jgi:phospholipid/cholesterol/gamma-HCH transport system substrate-binding protein
MRANLGSAIRGLFVFVAVCGLLSFALFAVFGKLRFAPETTYNAMFANVSGLKTGQFVRIAGVEVGKIQQLTIQPDTTVKAVFTADPAVVLTRGSRAVIRYDDLIGGRYMALEQGPGSVQKLKAGDTIPLSNTSPALDLDALIGGFRPLFRALNPDQTNALTEQLIKAFEGQGDTISSFLTQTGALTNKLANRDQLIGQVIVNLNTVLGSLGDQSTQFAKALDSLSALVARLASRKTEISDAVAGISGASHSIADLLAQSRPAITNTIAETDRTAALVVADHEYVDNLLATLPDAYQVLSRQGLYGDFFSFYLCELVLKVNGKGGQPVYVKLASQASGRCTPR